MVVATNSSAQIVHRYLDGRSASSLEVKARSSASVRCGLGANDSLPQPVQIHRTQSAVVEAVAGLTVFAPDHAAMIRANRPVESSLVQGREHGTHVDVTVLRRMGGLLERMRGSPLDVAAVHEVDTASNAFDDVNEIIGRIHRQ